LSAEAPIERAARTDGPAAAPPAPPASAPAAAQTLAALHRGGVWRRLLRYAQPHWGMFLIGVAGMALFAASDASLAYFVNVFLKETFVQRDPRVIWMVPAGAALLFLLRGIGDYVSNYFPGWVGRQVIKALRAELFAKAGHDLATLVKQLQKRQAASKPKVIKPPHRHTAAA
jgi:hypothetical protein